VSQGQIAHQLEPKNQTEKIIPVHQRFQVSTVAIFRSAMGVPQRPATIISRNNPTKITLRKSKTRV
jgi:hypothetical protein